MCNTFSQTNRTDFESDLFIIKLLRNNTPLPLQMDFWNAKTSRFPSQETVPALFIQTLGFSRLEKQKFIVYTVHNLIKLNTVKDELIDILFS